MRDSLKRLTDYAANPAKTEYKALHNALEYAEDVDKTASGESACFVTGVGCDAATVYEDMTRVKRHFGKLGGNVAYHAYQSFKPNEVTPEQCHAIGVELAKRLWGLRFQVLVATHLDKDHLHNHLLINSVSFVDGKKFNDDLRCYYRLREQSDALCREHGLSVIENPSGRTPRSIYFAEQRGEPTRYNLMREAIEAALKVASTLADLTEALRDMGYILNCDPARKYATLRRDGGEKAVRLYRLGEDYDLPAIRERLVDNQVYYGRGMLGYFRKRELKTLQPAQRVRMRGTLAGARKFGGLRALYIRYCFELGIYPENSRRKPLSPEMREECRRLDLITQQVGLICREGFKTVEDVQAFIKNKTDEMKQLKEARSGCYNRLRRCRDGSAIAQIKAERDTLTRDISSCRKELQGAQSVVERSERMGENLKAERALRAQKHEREQALLNKIRGKERNCER